MKYLQSKTVGERTSILHDLNCVPISINSHEYLVEIKGKVKQSTWLSLAKWQSSVLLAQLRIWNLIGIGR